MFFYYGTIRPENLFGAVIALSKDMRRLRFHDSPETVFEISTRCFRGQFLLTPTNELTKSVMGCIGRAMHLYDTVQLFAFVFLGNHYHLFASAPDCQVLSRFLGHLNSNVAREANRLTDWSDKFWSRRFDMIPITDTDALENRIDYLLAQGYKEGLIGPDEVWPGANSLRACCDGEALKGVWLDRSALYMARRSKKNKDIAPSEFEKTYPIPITPFPNLGDIEAQQSMFKTKLEHIKQQLRRQQASQGGTALGVERVKAQHPHDRPKSPKRSPKPWCLSSSTEAYVLAVHAYKAFEEIYRTASVAYRQGKVDAVFPPNCFKPTHVFVSDTG